MSQDFGSLYPADLDRLLDRFYLELRNPKGESYKKTTMMSYRHGIHRNMQTKRPDINIIYGAEFRKSCKVFKGVTIELTLGYLIRNRHVKMYDYLTSADSWEVL